ncbi:MAG: hypothetical protein ACI9LO_001527 [Planctomycetota bacterium]|jgi:hypothetical protein
MQSGMSAKLKVFYLFALATGLFFVAHWELIALIGLLQILVWFWSRLDLAPLLRAVSRLKWFILLVTVSYLLIPPPDAIADFQIDLGFYQLHFYLEGLTHAGLMLSRVLLLVVSGLWVRLSEPSNSFVSALASLGIPKTVAIVIDAGLTLTAGDNKKSGSGQGQGGGGGGGRRDKKQGGLKRTQIFFADIRHGRFAFMDTLIEASFGKASAYMAENYPQMDKAIRRDAAIVLMVVVAIMSLKLLQLLPGLPFAPGHKNIIVIPLLLMAAMLTRGRFGGFVTGFSVGIVSFLMGYGKFGVFEVLHLALPGLLADILVPILVGQSGFWLLLRLALLGGLMGLTRFATNFMILLLAGSPELAWLVFVPGLISQVVFGALSSLICVYVVKKIRDDKTLFD